MNDNFCDVRLLIACVVVVCRCYETTITVAILFLMLTLVQPHFLCLYFCSRVGDSTSWITLLVCIRYTNNNCY